MVGSRLSAFFGAAPQETSHEMRVTDASFFCIAEPWFFRRSLLDAKQANFASGLLIRRPDTVRYTRKAQGTNEDMVMPVKNLTGRPRPTAEQKALEKELSERRQLFLRRRPDHSDDEDGLSPVGPGPVPLSGAAEIADDWSS